MITLNVMTPLSRPINIPRIYSSLWHSFSDLRLRWIVVADADEPVDVLGRIDCANPLIEVVSDNFKQRSTGHAQRNYALDKLTVSGWCCWIDDDNVMHPAFLWEFTKYADAGWKGLIVGQRRGEGYVSPNLKHIDTGQITVHTDLIGDTRWGLHYTADGDFIREVFEKEPSEFIIVDEELSYHNRVRW